MIAPESNCPDANHKQLNGASFRRNSTGNWWGNDVDLSFFEQPGHEYDSVYDVNLIERELGFVAKRVADQGPDS